MSVITEVLTVKVKEGCGDNAVYLCWLNVIGGYDYWLFNKFQEQKLGTKLGTKFTSNISDFETALGVDNIVGKDSDEELMVATSIELEDISGMKGLFESTAVYQLMNPLTWETDTPSWRRVIIKAGSLLTFKTNKAYYDIKFTLSLPKRFTQQQ